MSQSADIIDYLKGLPEGAEFTSTDVMANVPGTTIGGTTGMMARLTKAKAILMVRSERGKKGRQLHSYVVSNLDRVGTRENPRKRRKRRGPAKKATAYAGMTRDQIVYGLERAADVLRNQRSLADYTTDELMKELASRVKK